ncbi:MAG: QueT transporter family protein [Youngiibacter sp.]|jgi:uncharacterized membrane protein|nr:QueT transporter family protein [Youngiibacter sp.]
MDIKVSFLVRTAIIAAIYAVITILNPFSWYGIQFRVSEVLTLLVFIDRKYIPGLVAGCFIANLPSPLGIADIFFGTTATFIALLLMARSKSLFGASLWPAIVNGLIIGLELKLVLGLPFFLSALQVFAGEFLVVSVVGYIVFKTILKDKNLVRALKFS